MRRNISVVLPTLLKDIKTLNNLVKTLISDEVVNEIIVIDNSLKGYEYKNEKVRVITPKENLFVNPSWNLGVKEAKNEYICLANDDIKIAENFCSKVLEKLTDDYGIIGINEKNVINTRDRNNNIVININDVKLETSKEVSFEQIKFRPDYFGIMMFFKKENYTEIPEDLKIYYGDDWLIYQMNKKKKINAICIGQEIYHLGSLSSRGFSSMAKNDTRVFLKHIVPPYKRFFYQIETSTRYIWFILGIKFYKNKKIL